MKKYREHKRHSLLAALLLAIAAGPAWAADTSRTEERMYREYLLRELREDLSLSLKDVAIAGSGRVAAVRPARQQDAEPARRKSSGATL